MYKITSEAPVGPCKGSWKLVHSYEPYGCPVLGRLHQEKEAVVAPVGGVVSDSEWGLGVAEHCPQKMVHTTL